MNPDAPDDPPALVAPPPVADAATPDDLLHLARQRARHGDYEGAKLLAAEALEIPGEHAPVARYLAALCDELDGRLQEALAAYDALLIDAPTDDTRFRRAECLGKLGRVAEARDQIAEISRLRSLTEADRTKIGVLSAVWDLELGKERKALRRLDAILAGAGDEAAYYQAMGRGELLAHALDQANALAFVGSDKAKGKALEARAELVALAEEQLAATIRLGEVSFALDGFLRLGESYEDLGVDLLAESPIEGLTPAQLEVNRDLLEERVEKIWVKGTLYFDRGLELAARDGWTGEPVPRMQASWDRLVARVDGLGEEP